MHENEDFRVLFTSKISLQLQMNELKYLTKQEWSQENG